MRTNKDIRQRIRWRVWQVQQQIDWQENCIKMRGHSAKRDISLAHWQGKLKGIIQLANDLIGDNEQLYYDYIAQRRKAAAAEKVTDEIIPF